MSSAQIIIHRRDNNHEYEITSENISDSGGYFETARN